MQGACGRSCRALAAPPHLLPCELNDESLPPAPGLVRLWPDVRPLHLLGLPAGGDQADPRRRALDPAAGHPLRRRSPSTGRPGALARGTCGLQRRHPAARHRGGRIVRPGIPVHRRGTEPHQRLPRLGVSLYRTHLCRPGPAPDADRGAPVARAVARRAGCLQRHSGRLPRQGLRRGGQRAAGRYLCAARCPRLGRHHPGDPWFDAVRSQPGEDAVLPVVRRRPAAHGGRLLHGQD
ncbi:hypothetical protein D9M71_191190 [compost metagenome]